MFFLSDRPGSLCSVSDVGLDPYLYDVRGAERPTLLQFDILRASLQILIRRHGEEYLVFAARRRLVRSLVQSVDPERDWSWVEMTWD